MLSGLSAVQQMQEYLDHRWGNLLWQSATSDDVVQDLHFRFKVIVVRMFSKTRIVVKWGKLLKPSGTPAVKTSATRRLKASTNTQVPGNFTDSLCSNAARQDHIILRVWILTIPIHAYSFSFSNQVFKRFESDMIAVCDFTSTLYQSVGVRKCDQKFIVLVAGKITRVSLVQQHFFITGQLTRAENKRVA